MVVAGTNQGTFPGALTVDELLAELAGADAIVLAATGNGRVQERRVTFEVAERELRAVARNYDDDARGFDPPQWVGRVAHVGPILGGFAV